jgi:hypothetical protein
VAVAQALPTVQVKVLAVLAAFDALLTRLVVVEL